MQIMFVIGIFVLNALILTNVNTSHELKVKSDVLSRQMYEKIEIANAIAPIVKIAYDLGQQQIGCPGTSRQVNLSQSSFKLCWVGLNANNCFKAEDSGGFNLCISSEQSLTYHPKINIMNLIINDAYAFSGGPGPGFTPPGGGGGAQGPGPEGNINRTDFNDLDDLNYTDRRDYSKGNYFAKNNTAPMNAPGLDSNTAGARVLLPTDLGGLAIRDYVNCQAPHTECFNVSFCANGTSNCSGKDKVTQTFAVRHY